MSRENQGFVEKIKKAAAPIILAGALASSRDQGLPNTQQVEDKSNAPGLPAEQVPQQAGPMSQEQLENNYAGEIILFPANWKENPKYQQDIVTYNIKSQGKVEVSKTLLADEGIVLTPAGTAEDGSPIYMWERTAAPNQTEPIQHLPNWIADAAPEDTQK